MSMEVYGKITINTEVEKIIEQSQKVYMKNKELLEEVRKLRDLAGITFADFEETENND